MAVDAKVGYIIMGQNEIIGINIKQQQPRLVWHVKTRFTANIIAVTLIYRILFSIIK